MAQKIISLAQFKKLYHEDVAKDKLSKADRQKAFEEMWDSLPDYEEGVTKGVINSKTKKKKAKAKKK